MKQTRLGKRVTAWLLCLAMVMTAINLPSFAVSVHAEELCEHSFGEYDNGFRTCSECEAEEYEAASYNEAEEVYEIGNAGQLYWFADKYNNAKEEMQTLNAKLTENITVNTNVLKTNEDGTYELNGDGSGFKKWTPIGTKSNKYSGNFDGNGKTISGLYYYNEADVTCAGFMGYIDSGALLHNMSLEDLYIEGYKNVGGAVGIIRGSTIEMVSVTGVVKGVNKSSGFRFGGIFGFGGYDSSISNCCFNGDVSGITKVGGLGGEVSDILQIHKCFVIARVQSASSAGVAFGNADDGTVLNSNVFSCVTTDVEDINREYSTELPLSAFTSGEVTYRLNLGMPEEQRVWRQNLPGDTYPNLNPTHSLVYEQEEGGVKTYSNTPNNSLDCRHPGIVKVDGYNYYHCDLCEKNYREQEAVHELKKYHKAVANSCTEDGIKEYWTYDADGVEKYFDGQEDILDSELILPALGHDFENGKCIRCRYECTHLLDDGKTACNKTTRLCSQCGCNFNCGAEGENGDNMYWYHEGDTLYIIGSGAMKEYGSSSKMPWYYARQSITRLVLDGSNIRICDYAFSNMIKNDGTGNVISGLKEVVGFENVVDVGIGAFSNCYFLSGKIDLRNVYSIYRYGFSKVGSLENAKRLTLLVSDNTSIDLTSFVNANIERFIVSPSEQNRDNVEWNRLIGIGINNTKLIFLGSVPPNDLNSEDSGNTIYYDKEDAETFDNLTTLKANNTYVPMTYHEAVEPTCTEKGHKAYWSYEEDGVEKYFDETGYDVEALTDLDIPIKHEFENGKCKLCGICQSVVASGNHDFSQQPYQTDDSGKHYQICKDCSAESEHVACTPGEAVRENIVAPTCGGAGSHNDVVYCTVCNQKLRTTPVTDPATGAHTYTKYVSLGNGKHKVVCKDCNAIQSGHDADDCSGGTATCKEKAKCSKCGAEYGSLAAHIDADKNEKCDVCGYDMHVHAGTKVAQVNATCKAFGVKEYYKCSCGKYYTDSACTKEITDLAAWKSGDGRIAKKDHTLKTTTTKATTSKNGKKETKCTVCGKVTKTETIYMAKTIKLSATSYTYDGKVKKPTVTIKDSKGKAIASSNYTITYPSGRKNVGKYTVKVTFKGNYSGTKSLTFTINPPKTSISKVTAGKKAFTVKWAKKTTQVTGYEIQYSTSSTFKSGNKTVKVTSAKTASKTISKLTGGKKYYVRVRTYKTVGKTSYYSDWSAKKSVTTKK